MQPQPDRRWSNFAGRVGADGVVSPMSYGILFDLSSQWADLVPDLPPDHDGPAALLKTSRSLFEHSWFDCDFMALACLVAFQAMEAAFRLLYPDADHVPARKLVRRAHAEGILPLEHRRSSRDWV